MTGEVKPIDKIDEAHKVFDKLRETNSCEEVAEIVDNLDEETAKETLKIFTYVSWEYLLSTGSNYGD